MSSAAEKIIKGNAKAFNKLRKHFFKLNGVESQAYLLRKIGETSNYETLLLLTDWYLTYEETRAQSALKVARIDSTFQNAFKVTTNFAISNSEGTGIVYTVDRRDKEEPKGRSFYYQLFGLTNGDKIPNVGA